MQLKTTLEGNNGGDIFELEPLADGRVRLKVSNCCVWEIDHIVPVEFLTSILVKAVLDAGSVEQALEDVNWPTGYSTQLVAQIERL